MGGNDTIFPFGFRLAQVCLSMMAVKAFSKRANHTTEIILVFG
jgi:hypothetical protein